MSKTNKTKIASINVLEERKRLKNALFFAQDNEPAVSAEDTATFLRLSAQSRLYLSHYTDLNGLLGILFGKRLWLTRVDCQNDLKEFKSDSEKRTRIFTASFATTRQESVAMWWMYGLAGEAKEDGRVPVQIVFPVRAIRHELNAMREDVHAVREEVNEKGEIVNGYKLDTAPLRVDKLDLFEILYFSNTTGRDKEGSILWNGNKVSCKRCADGASAKWGPLDGYVKDIGWAYEGETRLALELAASEKSKDILKVSIPFELPLDKVIIRVGPGRFDNQWHKKVLEELSKKAAELDPSLDIKERVQKSQYEIHFHKDQNS